MALLFFSLIYRARAPGFDVRFRLFSLVHNLVLSHNSQNTIDLCSGLRQCKDVDNKSDYTYGNLINMQWVNISRRKIFLNRASKPWTLPLYTNEKTIAPSRLKCRNKLKELPWRFSGGTRVRFSVQINIFLLNY